MRRCYCGKSGRPRPRRVPAVRRTTKLVRSARWASAREAGIAIHRLAARWPEGDHRVLTAVRAGGRVHLAWSAWSSRGAVATRAVAATTSVAAEAACRTTLALRLAGIAAWCAALWLGESAFGVKLLVSRREHELLAAIHADQGFVCVHSVHSYCWLASCSEGLSREP